MNTQDQTTKKRFNKFERFKWPVCSLLIAVIGIIIISLIDKFWWIDVKDINCRLVAYENIIGKERIKGYRSISSLSEVIDIKKYKKDKSDKEIYMYISKADQESIEVNPKSYLFVFNVFVTILVTSILSFTIRWSYDDLKESKAEQDPYYEIDHINERHKTIRNYGLARIHNKKNEPQEHYIKTLEIITRSYESLFRNGAKIAVTLFYGENMTELIKIAKNPHVDRLFSHWNTLPSNDIEINRVFICSGDAWNNITIEDRKDYVHLFPNIPCVYIDSEDEDISDLINEIKGDLDFAIFQSDGNKNMMCIGFIKGKVTYVLLGPDKFGPRRNILNRAKNIKQVLIPQKT